MRQTQGNIPSRVRFTVGSVLLLTGAALIAGCSKEPTVSAGNNSPAAPAASPAPAPTVAAAPAPSAPAFAPYAAAAPLPPKPAVPVHRHQKLRLTRRSHEVYLADDTGRLYHVARDP